MSDKQDKFINSSPRDLFPLNQPDSGLRWAVFISGQGTNLQALLDAKPPIQISVVVTSRAEAPGVDRAVKRGIPVILQSKESSWSDLSSLLKEKKIDYIFLLGFMKIVPEIFILEWKNKILNLHPSMLPHYKGLKAIERSYEENASMGVTIHWVTAELDDGPHLLQKEVLSKGQAKTHSFEKAESLVREAEKELVIEAVRRVQGC